MNVNGGNTFLGKMTIMNLNLSPKGTEVMDVQLMIDDKYQISATARDRRTQQFAEVKIVRPDHLSESDLVEMCKFISSLKMAIDIPNASTQMQLPHFFTTYKRHKYDNTEAMSFEIIDEICPIFGSRGSGEGVLDGEEVLELDD